MLIALLVKGYMRWATNRNCCSQSSRYTARFFAVYCDVYDCSASTSESVLVRGCNSISMSSISAKTTGRLGTNNYPVGPTHFGLLEADIR